MVSAYIEKAPARQTEDVQAPSYNVRNASDNTGTSTNIISQKAQKVKTENTKYQRGRAAKYDTRTVEEKEIDRLKHEVERLSKKNEYLKAETKVSADGTRRVEASWLKPITDELFSSTGTSLSKRAIAKGLRDAYESIINNPKDFNSYDSIVKPFFDIANDIVENIYVKEHENIIHLL